MLKALKRLFATHDAVTLSSTPDGAEAMVLADLARERRSGAGGDGIPALVYVARDGQRMQMAADGLSFFAPDVEVLQLPAWDCLPYDRVSPNAGVVARRLNVLAKLASAGKHDKPVILMTTVNAAIQRVPSREWMAAHAWSAAPGNRLDMSQLVQSLELNGYMRTPTVRDTGEYAVRGGILDLFAPGTDLPVRLDFFGDTLESIRTFDPETQRTVAQMKRLEMVPMSEIVLSEETISRFRAITSPNSAPPRATMRSISPSPKAAATPEWSTGCRSSTKRRDAVRLCRHGTGRLRSAGRRRRL